MASAGIDIGKEFFDICVAGVERAFENVRSSYRAIAGFLRKHAADRVAAVSPGAELPEPGSRPEGANRRPEADYPDKALACGAAFSTSRLHVARDDINMVCALAARRRFKAPRGPPDMDIQTFAALMAGQAGFHPSKRQQLPGTEKVWEGLKIFWNAVTGDQAISEWKKDRRPRNSKLIGAEPGDFFWGFRTGRRNRIPGFRSGRTADTFN